MTFTKCHIPFKESFSMKIKIKKNILNVFLSLIPFSKLRKKLRNKCLSKITIHKYNQYEKLKNKISNNKIFIVSKDTFITDCTKDGLDIKFIGKNSKVVIHEPISLNGCSIRIGNNSKVEIFSSMNNISNLNISAMKNSEIIIGENFSCCGCSIENHDESNLKVVIGNDCMFSYGIHIRVSDGHSIYQLNNSKIINKPQNGVIIGDHVWIGMNSVILKDVSIPSNSIIGACSLVNKSVKKENVIIAGSPAKIIKEDINWSRDNTDYFE